MQLRQTDQCRQKPLVDAKRPFERVSRRLDLLQLGARAGEVQPQLGRVRIAAARMFEMFGRRARIPPRKCVQPQRVARDRLVRVDRQHCFELVASVRRAARLASTHGVAEKRFERGIGHSDGW